MIPLSSSGQLREFALKNNGDLREEIGWDELVSNVAQVRDSLSPDQKASLGIVVGNYGEQGAIEILGPAYHLPPPISGTNSAWLRGYPVSSAFDADRDRAWTEVCRPDVHSLQTRRTQRKFGRREERGERIPSGYFCVRISALALAAVLGGIPGVRIGHRGSGCVTHECAFAALLPSLGNRLGSFEKQSREGRQRKLQRIGAAVHFNRLRVNAAEIAHAAARIFTGVTIEHLAPVATVRNADAISRHAVQE